MKKTFFFLASVMAAMVASAQVTVGITGSFSLPSFSTNIADAEILENNNGFTKQYPSPSTFFSISPKVGYKLSSTMEVGLGISYTHSSSGVYTPKYAWPTDDPTNKTVIRETQKDVSNSFGVSPYFRYTFVSYGSLNLFAEAQVCVDFGNRLTKIENTGDVPSGVNDVDDYNKASTLGLTVRIVPGINYEVTDHISLDVYMNFVGLGFNMLKLNTTRELGEDLAKEREETYTLFGLNNSNVFYNAADASLYNVGTAIGVGLNVKF